VLFIYRLLTRLTYSLIYPYARWQASRGNNLWHDRLGLQVSDLPYDIWLHASSVGEVKVISYLLHYLRGKQNGLRVMVTVMTKTGYRAAKKMITAKDTLSYLPLDCRPAVARALESIKPACIVIAETEIWPNLILEADRRKIPLIQINGRLSEKAFGKYRWFRSSMNNLLEKDDRFFFKTDTDAKRYQQLGVSAEQFQVIGDMKFDAPMPEHSEGRKAEIRYRAGVGDDDFLIVAGSTRAGEEALLLNVYRTLVESKSDINIRLALAPRHIERIEEVKQLCVNSSLAYAIYGQPDKSAPIILIDRMGILNDLYLAADIAFVGGTLVDIGGHNILEPIWAGIPALYGPYINNVLEASQYILDHNYGAKVSSPQQMADIIKDFMEGKITFAIRAENNMQTSPTAIAGDYILRKLDHV